MNDTPKGDMIRITASDGHEFDCWLEPARGERRGGIVILQEIFGVTNQLKGVAARYAAKGYDVAIPALFDRQAPGTVVPFDKGLIGRDLMLTADLDKTMMDVDAAAKMLASRGGKVGVIGFCWGGGLALRAAQKLDIGAAVAFYGTRLPQYLDSPLKAPLQGHFGINDSHVTPEMLAEAQAYLPDFEVYTYKAGHAFANDARAAEYVADVAEQAHARTEEFFAKHLA
ncbi:dienelactone hydrolase family protein [Breoghania sp. L-A4]|uniref:dienelactone hydrolase family protein n=1 Tax=Breoghania sp. L-A4 TaxID=2304600 RepID=UPI000E35BA2E|nr:dienelactone hydrolase family protein [Breoghania sp. L-A4]AXS41549.1 dienelactone hydrolase family protein [Breoghania sp. L-A4]